MVIGIHRREQLAEFKELSRRMVVRVGALLARKVALTAAVLEACGEGSPVERFLLSGELLDRAAELDGESFAALCRAMLPEAAPPLALALSAEGFKTLCLEEELLAESGWEEATPRAEKIGPGAAEAAAPAAPLSRIAGHGGPRAKNGVVSPAPDLAALRLTVLTSADEQEKIGALRRLAYLEVPAYEKGELFLASLSDEAPNVRREAAKLLITLGFSRDLADAIASLNAAEVPVRLFAADRLLHLVELAAAREREGEGTAVRTGELEVGAAAVSVITALKSEREGEVRGKLLRVLSACGPKVAAREERVREIVRLLVGLMATAYDDVWRPAFEVFSRFGRLQPELMSRVLWEERDKTSSRPLNAFLLAQIAGLAVEQVDVPRLAAACAQSISADAGESRESRLLGSVLSRLGQPAVEPLIAAFAQAAPGPQRYLVGLLDEICRFRRVDVPTKARAAQLLSKALDVGDKPLRMSVMECALPGDPALPEPARAKLAELFLENIGDFSFRAEIENAEATVARAGLPAVPPLLARVTGEYPPRERVRAVRILGELARRLIPGRGPAGARATAALREILRTLQRLSIEGRFPDPGALLAAMGQTCASGGIDRQAIEVVCRHLRERYETAAGKHRLLEGLSWIATSRKLRRERCREITDLLQKELDVEPPHVEARERRVEEETIFELGGGVEVYTDLIPTCLQGLCRIARGGSAGERIQQEITRFLLGKWQQVAGGGLIWGPAAARILADVLRDLGCFARTPPELRLEIIRALAPRTIQIPVMLAIADILAADDSAPLARPAAQAASAILRIMAQPAVWDHEDREHVLRGLGKIITRAHLDETPPRHQGLRRRILEALFDGLRDRVPGTYETLAALRDRSAMPVELKQELAERLREFEAIQLVG